MMTSTSKPNLLFIHSDQHCSNVTGCYGDQVIETPNLDALAEQGAVFENSYCSAPICVPSRASMLTGKYPHQNEVWTNEHSLDSSIPTMAHAMGGAGYSPVLAGRMHFIGPDQLHGYASRTVGDHSSNFLGGLAVDRGVLDGTAGPDRISLELSGPGQNAYQVHDEYVTASAVNQLNRLGVRKRAGLPIKPFSLTVGYMLPHPPYVAKSEDYRCYKSRVGMPQKPMPFSEDLHPFLKWWRKYSKIVSVTDEEIKRARAAYWGMTARLDALIGEVLTALRTNGLDQNTLIVYSTDHGDMLGEHGLWWKHTFYEESARVPLIMTWPGVIRPSQRVEQVVGHVDMNATILDALGAPALPNSEGRSILSLLKKDSDASWENLTFSEYCSDEYSPEGGCYQRMIRRDQWKLIYYYGYPPQLFNLEDDPEELINLADNSKYAEIRRSLTDRVLDGWSPDVIKTTMASKKKDHALLSKWAGNVRPIEQYRWQLDPAMNRLD